MNVVNNQQEKLTAILSVAEERISNWNEFTGKKLRIAYADSLVLNDLTSFFEKRYFNYDAGNHGGDFMYMNGETPLKFAVYVDCALVGYVIGRIDFDNNAIEVFYTEPSNFYNSKGLMPWIAFINNILCWVKLAINELDDKGLNKIIMTNPPTESIEALREMGYEFVRDYNKSTNAVILHINLVDNLN